MAEQTKMSEFSEKLAEKLSHFIRVERIIQKLNSPSLSVMSEAFPKLLDEIDESSAFLEQHVRTSWQRSFLSLLLSGSDGEKMKKTREIETSDKKSETQCISNFLWFIPMISSQIWYGNKIWL